MDAIAGQYQLAIARVQQLAQPLVTQRTVATQRIQKAKKTSKLDYDSDEDTEGGTWEHKSRSAEMGKTNGKE